MSQHDRVPTIARVAFFGNHLPRQCGIATFTTDLANALSAEYSELDCGVVAVNDLGKQYSYGERVRFEIAEGDFASYRRGTDFLNTGGFDVLSLQHEYGIFGGKAGSHVLSVLGKVRMPVVTTLHTILSDPSSEQRRVMDEVTRLSSRLVVMSPHGAELLRQVHGVPADKIDYIPHGIPLLPPRELSRKRLGVEGTLQLLTFGLLSPDKGLEYVINALPDVIDQHPTVRYVIVGATHPHVKEWHGEAYRRSLQLRAQKLGVEKHVIFHNRFVSASQVAEFLSAADIYLTPYLNPEQITSGTLAYAVGTGKPVISTPYQYARELLADERGVLVPMRDSVEMGKALNRLLSDPDELQALGARAAEFGQSMTWPAVARQYLESFERALEEGASQTPSLSTPPATIRRPVELPELNLHQLVSLSDDTGLLQHAIFSLPRYEEGYCIDDNARGLLLTTLIEEAGSYDRHTTRALSCRYLAFMSHAFNQELGRFRNFMSYSRQWLEEYGSEDSHGRSLWALGVVIGRAREAGHLSLATDLFRDALPIVSEFESPRAWAFALLGLHESLKTLNEETMVKDFQKLLADRLLAAFEKDAADDWQWCEDILTYENARLPQALILSGQNLNRPEMVEVGLRALQWLSGLQQSEEGYFAPIGSDGFYPRGGKRAHFDQQPVEACATVSACLDAWRVTEDNKWAQEMWRAFSWFLGENEVQISLYDPSTGGCRDGLHADSPNENQGAESTLSYLLARTEMATLDSEIRLSKKSASSLSTQELSGSQK